MSTVISGAVRPSRFAFSTSRYSAGIGAPFLVTWAQAAEWTPGALPIDASLLSRDSARVFDLSVSSADPTPSGVVLWTHIAPAAYKSAEPLYLQVARDANFSSLVLQARVEPARIAAGLEGRGPRSRWRMERTERPDGVTVVNDAYNANPQSMKAALQTLAQLGRGDAEHPPRRTIAVIGAAAVLGWLPGIMWETRRSRASS